MAQATKTKTSGVRGKGRASLEKKKATGTKRSSGATKTASGKLESGSSVKKSGKSVSKSKPGILKQAANTVSDVISGVAKPAKTGLKAGASSFLHEVADSIGSGKSDTGRSPKAKAASTNSAKGTGSTARAKTSSAVMSDSKKTKEARRK